MKRKGARRVMMMNTRDTVPKTEPSRDGKSASTELPRPGDEKSASNV